MKSKSNEVFYIVHKRERKERYFIEKYIDINHKWDCQNKKEKNTPKWIKKKQDRMNPKFHYDFCINLENFFYSIPSKYSKETVVMAFNQPSIIASIF